MPIDEIFARPIVKQVHFDIRYPNLFFIESRIGELQLKIMREFPDSSIVLRKQFVFAQQDEGKPVSELPQPEAAEKLWHFSNKNGVSVNVGRSALVISSTQHTTYNLGAGERFRSVIELICSNFLRLTSIPLLSRVGLRYVNECPLRARSTAELTTLLDTALPLGRFSLEDTTTLEFAAVVKRSNGVSLQYVERVRENNGQTFVDLDFDASAQNVEAEKLLQTTDVLHDVVSAEFDHVTKPALKEYMRRQSD